MTKPTLSVAQDIAAPAARVYALLADYRDGHPRILPRPPFGALRVEAGGMGSGTRISFDLRLLGRDRTCRAEISEPEPGRTLVETDVDTGAVTTFDVVPAGPSRCRLTISTAIRPRRGPAGIIERWLIARILTPVYERELALIAAEVRTAS